MKSWKNTAKRNRYLFSGLGADQRVFKNLMLQDFNPIYIGWPQVSEETTKDQFLMEIKSQIRTNKNNVFLGVSFGGIIAQDLATLVKPDCLVLVSSVESVEELPGIAKSRISHFLINMLPKALLNKPNPLLNFLFSIKTKESRKTLTEIIQDTSPTFIKWALRYIVSWRRSGDSQTVPIYRIHGDNDRIFPLGKMQRKQYIIPWGGHFAVYEDAATVSLALADIFEQPKEQID